MPQQLTQSLKAESERLGFALTGACPAVTPQGFHTFAKWLDDDYAGEMSYLSTRLDAYEHPQHVLANVKSLLMLGMNYQTIQPVEGSAGTGRIARYAWGDSDYHDLIHQRLKKLIRFVNEHFPNVKARGVVDTAPLLEREFAQLAGLGWHAKNTMLISRDHGSWFFIAAILVDVELEYDAPFTADHCGTCRACLDACPTDAFPVAGKLDANRCISYLTIEHRSSIPLELRPLMGDWILGCDICQQVCPWNRKSSISDEPDFQPKSNHNPLDLRSLFWLNDDQFRQQFRKTPLWRPKRRGILRNAAIALGNQPHEKNLDALEQGIRDPEPLVRGASAWALGRHRNRIDPEGKHKEDCQASQLLIARQQTERDSEVLKEIQFALSPVNPLDAL